MRLTGRYHRIEADLKLDRTLEARTLHASSLRAVAEIERSLAKHAEADAVYRRLYPLTG